MQRKVTVHHNEDTYETLYNIDTYSFGVVWRTRNTPNDRPRPYAFSDLPTAVQHKLENQAINPR